MPLPEQAQVRIPQDTPTSESIFTTPSSAPSTPQQDYDPRVSAEKPAQQWRGDPSGRFDDRAIITERSINSIPIFPEHDRRLTFPANTTEIPSSSGLLTVNLVGDGVFSIPFQKFETWTDVKYRFHASGYADVDGTSLAIRARLTDQAGKLWELPTFVRFYFSTADTHQTFYGERRSANIPPGTYTLTFRWETDANSFFFTERDTMHGSITEANPIP